MKKRILGLVIIMTIFISIVINFMVKVNAEEQLNLSVDGYYEISNVNDWYSFVSIVKSDTTAKARLVDDIDFTGVSNLVDYKISTFNGIFDGQGYTVKNINAEITDNFSLFYTISANGIVKNMEFYNIKITSTTNYKYVQLISNTNRGTISDININNITLNAQYTTIAAYQNYGIISEIATSNIDLDAKYSTGAIVSTNNVNAIISKCKVISGTVTVYNSTAYSDVYGGGIVGTNNGNVEDCSNASSVEVTGDRTVGAGGIVGNSTAAKSNLSTVVRCSNLGNITSVDLNIGNGYDYAGGITGSQSSGNFDIIECYNTGNVTAVMVAGGISGTRPYGSTNVINNCWNSGTIKTTTTNTSYGSGGISGKGGNAIVKNCLNVGDVLTGAYGAPLIATSSGTQPGSAKLVNSYAIDGCVKGVTDTTTLVGSLYYGYDENGNRISSGVTETQLVDGTILTALNSGNTELVWGQVEGGSHPILLNNNNSQKTKITIQGVTAVDKVYDSVANVGYMGTISTTPIYDVSKIVITYEGILADGTKYESSAAPTEVGDYIVIFSIPSTDLQNSGELKLSFKITKQLASDIVTPAPKTANLNSTLNDIVLEEGWEWKDGTSLLNEEGTFEYDVYYILTEEQLAKYDYSLIVGYNQSEGIIERKISIIVVKPKIDFENCENIQLPYGTTITIDGKPKIGEKVLVKDEDYIVEIYSIDETGNVKELLTSIPSNIGKYLVYINVDNTKYGSDYEIIGGEPTTLLGENAETLASTYKCTYIIEITSVILSVEHGPINVSYTSQPIQARPIVKNGGVVLQEGVDYEITYYKLNSGIVGDALENYPINIGSYLYVIKLKGIYDSKMYSFEGGIPTIIPGTTEAADLTNYSCCGILIIGNVSSGEIDLTILDELDQAIVNLEQADKEDAEALAKAIIDLTVLVQIAESTAKTANDELQVLLEGKIKEAQDLLNKSISDLEEKINQAIADLELKISQKADKTELAKAITDLTTLIETAESTAKTANDELQVLLESKIKEAQDLLNKSISDLEVKLEQAILDLKQADKENTEALTEAVKELTRLVELTELSLEQADRELRETLEEKLFEAVQVLSKTIGDLDVKLDKIVAELKQADKEDAEALAKVITDLTALIESSKEAANVSDEILKQQIEKIEKELKEALDSLKEDLIDAEESAAKDNAELEEKLNETEETLSNEIKSAIILPTIIGVISLIGNAALLTYIIIKRKK